MGDQKKEFKRVVAFHDLSGFSKCALSVVIPTLSAMSFEVLPVPTAILSANMSIPGFSYLDMTENLKAYLEHWKGISLKSNALYSGYLSSPAQVSYIEEAIDFLEPEIILIDPVMGDNGKLYKSTDPLMKDGFLRLIKRADIITPNLTEACLLTGFEYDSAMPSDAVNEVCLKLVELGAKNIIITGVVRENMLFNCIMTDNSYSEQGFMELPYKIGGTGDLFASVLLGKIMDGENIEKAVQFSSKFVYDVMKHTALVEDYKRRGICFEPFLSRL